ncbi:hypothetical protein [Sinosporangium siamense]|uniref:Extradiol ring-cleavage dioxygenase LigAB LigA subunit domain-containing protein n=2 Tax=Sinosporangium siamense TaxID=1367973 RepID=A0A919V9W2_9ACTN|nr:hypothetical protein [Sinosporangium siamense]GII90514.1 hypothetical protein Ssi02_07450 [Sinosporangium siamense]
MSKYALNAFMRDVNMDPDCHREYVRDPAGFAAAWRQRANEACALTDTEFEALAARDYGAIYGLGGHPYLLWSFAEAVWVPEITRPELVESYRVRSAAHGYPDTAT